MDLTTPINELTTEQQQAELAEDNIDLTQIYTSPRNKLALSLYTRIQQLKVALGLG